MKMLRGQKGQGMTEYILLVALIAIAVIVAVKYFGSKTKTAFTDSADTVSGQVSQANKDAKGK
jgi:Flp pilus assembly pilin Flp